jgi:hypothetical protein
MFSTKVVSIAIFTVISVVSSGCGNQPTNSNLSDEFDGADFWYYDSADRKQLVLDSVRAIDERYGALYIKESRIGLKLETLSLEAQLAEQREGDVAHDDVLGQAKANIDFLDRMQATVARFQDTHFWFDAVNARPFIFLGFEVANVEGSFRIVALSSDMMRYNDLSYNTNKYSALALGDEILSIDGRTPESAVAELAAFQNASSPAYALIVATKALTERDHFYPHDRLTVLTIKRGNGTVEEVTFPWYVDESHRRLDAKVLLNSRGFDETAELKHVKAELAKIDGLSSEDYALTNNLGFYARDPFEGMTEVSSWTRSSSSRGVLRTGFVEREGRRYGVLQVYGYSSPVKQSGSDNAVDFLEPIRAFVLKLKADNLPLIIDLRSNGGGDPYLAIGLLSIIARDGDRYPATTQSFRVTRRVRQLVETFGDAPLDLTNYDAEAAARHFMKKAVRERSPYTAIYADAVAIQADPLVGGYSGEVVALVTPSCISSCDVQAMLFQNSGRVTLIGEPANGTGAGGRGNSIYSSSPWVDGNQVLTMSVPNELFGYPGAIDQLTFENEGDLLRMNSENRPVEPHVTYQATMLDYLKHGTGWLDSAVEILDVRQRKTTKSVQ